MAGFGGGLAGLNKYWQVFGEADWVDTKLAPGCTSTEPRTGQPGWWYAWPKVGLLGIGLPFIYSPNLVWFFIALVIYVLFPYDFEAARVWRLSFVLERLLLNLHVGMGYYAFWHITLYSLKWGQRKFNKRNAGPSKGELFHNVWYCLWGMVAWTVWELGVVHLFATGKAAYTSDQELFSSMANFLPTLFWVLAMPVFRDFHFYFTHRLIHVRAFYTYIHSLHHRNKDPEPFAGMCMHPIEHIYYLSCAALSYFVTASPFVLTFNLIHAVLAPAAGHSGYEDHWQSDQFHHLHHQYFECNYGNIGFPWDKWFGTIRHHIGDGKDYKGGAKDATMGNADVGGGYLTIHDAEGAYLRGHLLSLASLAEAFPTRLDHQLFWAVTVSIPVVLACAVSGIARSLLQPQVVGIYVSIWPLVAAQLLSLARGDRMPTRWPFHKDALFGRFGFTGVMALLIVLAPTYLVAAGMVGSG